MGRGEQISQRDLDWSTSYQGSKEFASWHELHEGQDPLTDEPVNERTSPAIASIVAAARPLVSQAQMDAAQAALVARMAAPPKVLSIEETPQMRYGRWLDLQARVQRNEALSAAELNWFEGYASGSEWHSQKRFSEFFASTSAQVLTG